MKVQGSLDTNILLRYLLADIPPQTRKIDLLLSSSEKFVIHEVVIVELVFVLEKVYELNRGLVIQNLRALMSHVNLVFDRSIIEILIPKYREKPKLSFLDCYITCKSKIIGASPVYTFDAKMAKQLKDVKML